MIKTASAFDGPLPLMYANKLLSIKNDAAHFDMANHQNTTDKNQLAQECCGSTYETARCCLPAVFERALIMKP